MNVTVKLSGQARKAAGVAEAPLALDDGATVAAALKHLAAAHTDLSPMLFDAGGAPHRALMLFVNDEQVMRGEDPALADGDVLTVVPPISGG